MNRFARIVASTACAGLAAAGGTAAGAQVPGAEPPGVRDIVLRWTAADGTPLEGKLSVPAGATGPVPVVFYLHGAGPSDYDRAVRFRDAAGQVRTVRYYDTHARELARLGVAFFRMSKRGCAADSTGRPTVDRAVFRAATPAVLLDDYAAALAVLRRRPEVDPGRVALFGASEGTRLAPQLARRAPEGIVGLVLTSYQSDNQHTTIVWQNTVGPWRNVRRLIPAADDGALTRAEYDAATAQDPSLAARLPFAYIDRDSNGVMTETELAAVVHPRLEAILRSVEQRDDDFLWQNLLNLTSAYLLDGWDGEPTSALLLPVTVPIGIFHGELDGTTRVEGVRETAAAFAAAGRSNLTVRTYAGHDHDLGWTARGADGPPPEPLRDAFRFAADLLRGP